MTDPLGPKNLGNLQRTMVSHVRAKQAVNGMLRKKKDGLKPNKVCQICLKMHSPSGIDGDESIKEKPCEACQKQLDEGQIALTCVDGRHAFVFSAHLVGQEQIIPVSKETMDAVAKRAGEIKPPSTDEAA
jgi:hypothetical protein